MQEKSDDLVRKNKSLHHKNKGMLSVKAIEYLLGCLVVIRRCVELSAELETRVD
jgi:hypothetical protein